MGPVCLDTDALIEFVRGNEKIVSVITPFSHFFLSTMSIYEYGRGRLSIDQLKEDINNFNVLTTDYIVALKALEIYKGLVKKGELIDDNDIIIAASCIINHVPLLTLNKKHFERLKKFGLILA